mmetsp:Transcript_21245/g.44334  ORF Transcript_21245/g.44334 Transcript_21245/m.44334 type:complete len:117 (-) Transcript_21245:146-496(-)
MKSPPGSGGADSLRSPLDRLGGGRSDMGVTFSRMFCGGCTVFIIFAVVIAKTVFQRGYEDAPESPLFNPDASSVSRRSGHAAAIDTALGANATMNNSTNATGPPSEGRPLRLRLRR